VYSGARRPFRWWQRARSIPRAFWRCRSGFPLSFPQSAHLLGELLRRDGREAVSHGVDKLVNFIFVNLFVEYAVQPGA
jgi:hypothetical protein